MAFSWDVVSDARSLLSAAARIPPWFPIGAGLGLGILGAALIFSLLVTRRRAVALAAAMTRTLAESEARLSRVLEGSTDAWFDWDMAGEDHIFSRSWWHAFGYEEGEIKVDFQIVQEWFHPEDAAKVQVAFMEAIQGAKNAFQVELRMRHKLGHYIPILSRAVVVKDAAGRPIRFSGTNKDLTSRHQTQAKVRRYSDFLGMVRDAMIVSDEEFRIQEWNAPAERVFGWTAEEVIGKPASQFFRTEFSGITREEMVRDLRRQGYWRGEVVQRDKSGRRVEIEMDASEIRDPAGKITGYLSFNRDISERKQSEHRLHSVNALLRAILENGTFATFTTSVDGVIRFWNPAAVKLFGYQEDEVVETMNLVDFHDPAQIADRAEALTVELGREVEPGFEAFVAKSLAGLPNEHVWISNTKQGAAFHGLLGLSCIRDPKGALQGFAGVVVDRTREIRADKALKEYARVTERALLELEDQKFAMDQHSLVSITDVHGKILYANSMLRTVSGFSSEELLGRDHRILNSGHHSKEFFREMYQAIRSGKVWRGEIRNRAKDGSFYWVQTTIVPLMDEARKPRQFIAIRTDITSRKRAEEDLLVAKDAAERSNRAKSEFLATMSHEIRTPLNGVLGMANLLLDTDLNKEQRELTRTMKYSGVLLLSIINDILDYSKIEAGKLEIESTPFDLESAILEVVEFLGYQAARKRLSLQVLYPCGMGRVALGDPGRVRQVLMNLLANAIKFTESGGIEIVVEQSGDRLKVNVVDSGIGIPAEKQDRLFKKFSQADASTTRRFGGTGLGLAISKRIMDLMGGELGFQSIEAYGSIFWFSLPSAEPGTHAVPHSARTDWTAAPKAETGVSPSDPSAASRILLVEDNVVNQKVAAGMLRKLGCVVDFAANGLEAVDMATAFPYAMVLMDCQMPEMDGFEATRKIREWESARAAEAGAGIAPQRLRIVALTAGVLVEDRNSCFEAGMDGFLSKPLQRAELGRLIAELRAPATGVAPSNAVPPS